MRNAVITRKTNETNIELSLELDGIGHNEIDTGCGFLDHMLNLFASHGKFDLKINCEGDKWVDYHHTVEDVGICLGQAFLKSLGDKKGINRYGNFMLPMDESLILTAIDFSGRSYLNWDIKISAQKVGDFDTELAEEFWLGFTRNSLSTLHFKQLSGTNAHHIIECAFKSVAHAIKEAVKINPDFKDDIPSTKGIL